MGEKVLKRVIKEESRRENKKTKRKQTKMIAQKKRYHLSSLLSRWHLCSSKFFLEGLLVIGGEKATKDNKSLGRKEERKEKEENK